MPHRLQHSFKGICETEDKHISNGYYVTSRPGMTHSNKLIFTLDTFERNVIGYVHLFLNKMFNKSFALGCLFFYYYVVSFYDRPYHLVCVYVRVNVYIPMASTLYISFVCFILNLKEKISRAFPPNFVICQFENESTWWDQYIFFPRKTTFSDALCATLTLTLYAIDFIWPMVSIFEIYKKIYWLLCVLLFGVLWLWLWVACFLSNIRID